MYAYLGFKGDNLMTKKKKRNRWEFVAPKFQDFTIRDEDGIVGHIRIKPNAIAWKPKGQHKTFNQISIEQFADYAFDEGKEVKN